MSVDCLCAPRFVTIMMTACATIFCCPTAIAVCIGGYQAGSEAGVCTPCLKGQYSAQNGTCQDCPTGKTTLGDKTSSTDASVCSG
jgi:hypothetical protein